MTAKKIKILFVDDSLLLRECISFLMGLPAPGYSFFVTESPDGLDAIEKIKNNNYDVAIVDYQLPYMNGDEVIRRILKEKPDMKILAISNYAEHSCVNKMLKAGASGYMLKQGGRSEIIYAIEMILSGKMYLSPLININLAQVEHTGLEKQHPFLKESNINRVTSTSKSIKPREFKLTPRQTEVLKLKANGLPAGDIAKTLDMKVGTVYNHIHDLLNKFNVKDSLSLVKSARKGGYI